MLKGERGVTIIELIMALAIAGLLATSVLFGRDQLLGRQQFTQGVDQVVEAMSNARNQANGTVGNSDSSDSNRGRSGSYIYAKNFELKTNGTMTVSTRTVLCGTDPYKCLDGNIDKPKADPYTVNIPWGVVPTTNVNLWFGLQDDGTIKAYTVGAGPLPVAGNVRDNGVAPISAPTIVATLTDSHMHTATITIDQYGNITRQFP